MPQVLLHDGWAVQCGSRAVNLVVAESKKGCAAVMLGRVTARNKGAYLLSRVSSRALSAGRLASRAVVQWMIRMVRLIALAKPRVSPLVGNLGD